MKKKIFRTVIHAFSTCCVVVLIGLIGLRIMYSDRVLTAVSIGEFSLQGLRVSDIPMAMSAYEQQLRQTRIRLQLRGRTSVHTVEELGITVNKQETMAKVHPVLTYYDDHAREIIIHDFAEVISLPKDATLQIDAKGNVIIEQSAEGEDIDMAQFDRLLDQALSASQPYTITIPMIRADALVNAPLVEQVGGYVELLVRSGFELTYGDSKFLIEKKDITAMIQFSAFPTPRIVFKDEVFQEYLQRVIAPKVHTDPVNARFQMDGGVVKQFALPKNGTDIDTIATMRAVTDALMQHRARSAVITQDVVPAFTDVESSASLGITSLLAVGETDFKGSPKNRIHNIGVGAEKYNGVLVAPGEEFSFLKLLGAVDATTGYLPELVIKDNKTIPEYGGGLCQVSTTAFRTAMLSGMKITERHNHSYAVRYYGTPGFDATIYPPYTDFRFLNTTPGYLLIQTHIDGTKLIFEFWGTNDKRHVEIDGPHPYDRLPDGSVKSILKRTVTNEAGEVIEQDSFRSNYKSPSLFPHESPAKQSADASNATTSAPFSGASA